MDWKEAIKGKEAQHWKGKYERTVKLCKAIEHYRPYVGDIKGYLSLGDDLGASQLWLSLIHI